MKHMGATFDLRLVVSSSRSFGSQKDHYTILDKVLCTAKMGR